MSGVDHQERRLKVVESIYDVLITKKGVLKLWSLYM